MAIFKDYISLKDAASISGYHSDYIGALVRSGKIQGKKNGNKWTVSESQVRNHFSKKHYVPVSHFFLSRKVIIFGTLVVVSIFFFSIFFVGSGTAASVSTTTSAYNSSGLESTNTPIGRVIIQQP